MATNVLTLSATIKTQLVPSVFKFLSLPSVRHFNANRAVVTKVKRNLYERTYPTVLVLENGATINIKYSEPRMLLRMPVHFDQCSPEIQRLIRQRRMPKGTVKVEKEIDFAYDPMKYVK